MTSDNQVRAEARGDTCPTCGIGREYDGPHYTEALAKAGKPMCPDPFHEYADLNQPTGGEHG